jgi:hypothetical protein
MSISGARSAKLRWLIAGAVLLFGCKDDPAPVFEVAGSGGLEGLVFLDNDVNGRFDPSAGDLPLPNVRVSVRERGTAQVIAGTTVQTNASGRFQVSNLPIGTHDLTIDTVGLGATRVFCQNPIPITVFLNETQFQEVAARGGCVITIAEAELRALGTAVTVRGVLTSPVNQFLANTGYIEDASGGTQLFRFPVGTPPYVIGDVLEVSGVLAEFNNELEIVDARVNSRTAGTAPTPKVVNTARIAAAGPNNKDPDQGRFVQVIKAQLASPFNAGAGRNANINDGSGIAVVRIEAGVTSDTVLIDTRYTSGRCYNIRGILRNFRGTAQLTPRSFEDMTEVPCN